MSPQTSDEMLLLGVSLFLFAASAFAYFTMGVVADTFYVSGLLGGTALYLNHLRMRRREVRWRGLKSTWVATGFLVILATGQLIKDNREAATETASTVVTPVVALIVVIVSLVTGVVALFRVRS